METEESTVAAALASDSESTDSTDSVDVDSESSDDENEPDPLFIATVRRMHAEGELISLVETSFLPQSNPLLYVGRNGSVNQTDVNLLDQHFPEFFMNLMRAKKKHGDFSFLNRFMKANYAKELHELSLLRLSQLQYLQIAITHCINN